MSNGRLNNEDRLFIRLAADGTAIASSAMWRKQKPRGQGNWKDITAAVAKRCSSTSPTQSSFLVITNANASKNITGVSLTGYTWSGTLTNGDVLVVPLPFNTDAIVTITTSSTGGTLTSSHTQGTGGTIGAMTVVTSTTSTAAISQTPGNQYKIAFT